MRHRLQFLGALERDDARERNIETLGHGGFGHGQRFGEAVHDAGHATGVRAGALFLHQADRVVAGGARVDDQGLAGFARGANVDAEALALPFQVAFETVIVQAGFADGDDLRVVGQLDQLLHGRLRRVFIVGVDADRGEDVGMLLCQGEHLREVRQVDRHAQRVRHLVLGHLGQDFGHAGCQFREIDVAMGIDIHPTIVKAGGRECHAGHLQDRNVNPPPG